MMMSIPFSLLVLSMISLRDTKGANGNRFAIKDAELSGITEKGHFTKLMTKLQSVALEAIYHGPPYSWEISSETSKEAPKAADSSKPHIHCGITPPPPARIPLIVLSVSGPEHLRLSVLYFTLGPKSKHGMHLCFIHI